MDSDDTYRGYEKAVKAGIRNICVHKGLWGRGLDARFPRLAPYARVDDVAKAAKDWPQLNFIIYHAAYRLDDPAWALAEFEQTGRIDWVTDLAEIPARHGVSNVYADSRSDLCADADRAAASLRRNHGPVDRGAGYRSRLLGHGRGVDRLAAMADRGAAPARNSRRYAEEARLHSAGPANGALKNAIFGGNNARLYGITTAAEESVGNDAFATIRADYLKKGATPSNRRYGYVART